MDPLTRFLVTLPVTLPLLGLATFIDYLTAPISDQLCCDPAEQIAEVAFWISGG